MKEWKGAVMKAIRYVGSMAFVLGSAAELLVYGTAVKLGE